MKELTVGLDDRSYPIVIKRGLLDEIGSRLHSQPFAKRYAIIADDHVADLFGERLLASLRQNDIRVDLLTFAEGEASKNLATIAELASSLARPRVISCIGVRFIFSGIVPAHAHRAHNFAFPGH